MKEQKINVAICDDAQFLCEGYKEQLQTAEYISFVGMAHSAKQCVELVENGNIDVLLLDIRMETERAGIEVIPKLKDIDEDMKIIMLTGYDDDNYVFEAFANGADNYCIKDTDIDKLCEKIKNVYHEVSSLNPDIQQKLVKKTREMYVNNQSILLMYNRISSLTAGEFELLSDLYYGANYKKIAAKRCVEPDSVRKMATRLLSKFDIKNMNELILQLKQLKFFETISQNKK